MTITENIETAKSMRLLKNKLRVAFGFAASLPSDKACRAFHYFDFAKGDNFIDIKGPNRSAKLYYPDYEDIHKAFTEKDIDSLRDYLEDSFRRAGLSGAEINVEVPSYCKDEVSSLDINLSVGNVVDQADGPTPEDKMIDVLLNIDRAGTKARIKHLRDRANEMVKVFGRGPYIG